MRHVFQLAASTIEIGLGAFVGPLTYNRARKWCRRFGPQF